MQGVLQNSSFNSRSGAFIAAAAAMFAGLWVTEAGAVSLRVKLACASDYHALCSQYESGSPEVRTCMRAAGNRLSSRCLNALIA